MINKFDMKLTDKMAKDYQRANRKKKGEILDDYCRLTAVSRNTAAKRFQTKINNPYPRIFPNKKKGKRGPKKKYSLSCQKIVEKCWFLSGNVCGEKLHPMITVYLDQLDKNGQLKNFCQKDISLVRTISLATLKRIINRFPSVKPQLLDTKY